MGQYDLPVHRYRELKHFCLQYGYFKKMYDALCMPDSETEKTAILKVEYENAIKLIETTAYNTSISHGYDILNSVTTDTGYSEMKELREKFFWLLSKEKGI